MPGVAVVYAGRTQYGTWCECGSSGCLCDPGECPGGGMCLKVQEDDPQDSLSGAPSPDPSDGVTIGLGIAILFAFVLHRLRG